MNDTLLSVLAAMAAMEIEAKSIAQRAGIEHARNCGKPNGRKPSFTSDQPDATKRMLESNMTIHIARATGLQRQAVYRIKDDPAAAEATLARWSGEPANMPTAATPVPIATRSRPARAATAQRALVLTR